MYPWVQGIHNSYGPALFQETVRQVRAYKASSARDQYSHFHSIPSVITSRVYAPNLRKLGSLYTNAVPPQQPACAPEEHYELPRKANGRRSNESPQSLACCPKERRHKDRRVISSCHPGSRSDR